MHKIEDLTDEARTRKIKSSIQTIVKYVCIAMCLFHLYTSAFGGFPVFIQRPVHLTFALVLCFLLYPVRKGYKGNVPWYDLLACLLAVFLGIYFVLNEPSIVSRPWYITPITVNQYIITLIGVILVLEAARRTVGNAFVIITLFFIAYVFLGPYLPASIGHRGVALNKVIDQVFLTTEGIFGIPLGVSATFVFNFILFGSFLKGSGVGQFITDIALSVAGKQRGGPAKVAVLASAGMGTVSGSVVGNIVTTGTFTIPLMKRLGYKPEFAGAVESVASTGGMIMPPVMGATAFIIAEFTGIPYIEICKYALLPAVLYFLCIFFMIDFEAAKLGLRGLNADELPSTAGTLRGCYKILPLIIVVVLIIIGFTPTMAGLAAILSTVAVSLFSKNDRMGIKKILVAFEEGAKNAVTVATACACAGIVIAVVGQTGLGLRLSSIIISLSFGIPIVALILCMIASIILGMGLTVTPAYIIQAALIIPVIIKLGIIAPAAHLFAFYFSCISAITPPVAIGSYAGAALAEADAAKTSWNAIRLGAAAYIVPYMFAFGPALLLIGSPADIVLGIITSIFGVYSLAAGVQGWLIKRANLIERLCLILAALTLIKPGLVTDVLGLSIFFAVWFYQKYKKTEILGTAG